MADLSFTCCPLCRVPPLTLLHCSQLVGWSVFNLSFLSTKNPTLHLFSPHSALLWYHQKLFPAGKWSLGSTSANPNLTVVQSAGRSALTLKLVEKLSHTAQKLQKSGPRNPRDDSPLPALLSRWHVFPRPAVIFGFLRQHYQIFTLNR